MSKHLKTPKNFSTYLLLHFAVFVLALSTVCSKFASTQDFMSPGFIALYACVIGALGIYAIIWQQVLKKIPLTNAFVNKSASLFWSLLWGVTLFGETISPSMIIGIIIVFIGVILVVTDSPKPTAKQTSEGKSQDE